MRSLDHSAAAGFAPLRLQHLRQQKPKPTVLTRQTLEQVMRIGSVAQAFRESPGGFARHVAVSSETASEQEADAGYRDTNLSWLSYDIRGSPYWRSTNRLPFSGE
jgi:hypothetical protein